MDIEFDAHTARYIADSRFESELASILVDIKTQAESGKGVLHVYKSLHHKTVQELLNKDFRVVDHPSISSQKDNLYYSIYW